MRLVRSLVSFSTTAVRTALVAMCFGCLIASGSARAISVQDDFSDGNDDGWLRSPVALLSGLPAIYDASSGRYQLSSTGIVAESETAIAARYAASVGNTLFGDGTLRVGVRLDTPNTSAVVTVRSDGTSSGYNLSFNNALDSIFLLASGPSRSSCTPAGPCYDVLGSAPFSIAEGTDYELKLEVIGSTISVSAWESSASEPLAPMVVATDSVLTSGTVSLVISSYFTVPPTQPISGSFDNFSFVPEPSTALLFTLGLIGMSSFNRRVALR